MQQESILQLSHCYVPVVVGNFIFLIPLQLPLCIPITLSWSLEIFFSFSSIRTLINFFSYPCLS